MDKPPKVFISYSRKNEEYKETVLQLATRLRRDGVDVILDQWHLRPGHDMYAFMEDSIREADKVLILCEESYVKKANAREGGAGTEARIISPTLYPESRQEKCIPVFMENYSVVPTFLKGRIGISYQHQSEAEYKKLLNAVLGIPEVEIPPLGSAPSPVEDFNFEVSDDGVTITRYKGTGGAVVIPSKIGGKPVTSIGSGAFHDCTGLTSVRIPDSVISIKYAAFRGCTGLTSVMIPDSVTSIVYTAFANCASLHSIVVSKKNPAFMDIDGVLYNRERTALLAFPKGKETAAFIIPDSVTSIGGAAFSHCTGLTSVRIPDSVTSIGEVAFWGCTGLTSVTIPDSVTSIKEDAFAKCASLHSIVVSKKNPAFMDIDGVLYNRERTALLAFPKGKETAAFIIPDSVTSIGGEAFEDCTGLTSVTIPDSVTSIEKWALYGCEQLKDVYYTGSKSQWEAIEIDYFNASLTAATIHYNSPKPTASP